MVIGGGGIGCKKADILKYDLTLCQGPSFWECKTIFGCPYSHMMCFERSVRTLGGFTKKYANEEDVAIYLVL
jgi:hypothetical protein